MAAAAFVVIVVVANIVQGLRPSSKNGAIVDGEERSISTALVFVVVVVVTGSKALFVIVGVIVVAIIVDINIGNILGSFPLFSSPFSVVLVNIGRIGESMG